ncbi:MraY family glycosyltransferase [Nitrococcus mobilis]|uniref:Undecaprenyl-phosphate alpha-N-acetylglucosaminephosphotransferase n=1 Tax=Nitrococcus mobilis Nb-231 TaxID=314278 RepID=A4BNE7_9GAMM|nr:MraY family glycosyltransferase [Nitrococcus mobilis]EAR22746.1 undecaprenyl-phosphate alpha-N-acetylglucosaminephosphotransferase [Nitrococcus mobilis Nb-231]
MMNEVFAYLLIFLFVALLTDFLRRQAHSVGLMDYPSSRKRHQKPVPPVGGEAIFIGCLISVLALGVPMTHVAGLFAIGAIIVLTGALDDYYNFSPRSRLLAQTAAALAMALLGGATVEQLGAIAPDGQVFHLHAFAVPFTVLGVVGVINALNMVDGMDGLSGSLALVALIALALIAQVGQAPVILAMVLVMASGIAAFLTLNLRSPWRWRASVFLGDAGSMFLGFALSWFIIRLSQDPVSAMSPVTGLWLLTIPLFDVLFALGRRILSGHHPFLADRQHLHHFFLRVGFSVSQTLGLILAFAIASAAIGTAGEFLDIPDRAMLLAFCGLFALYCLTMTLAWRAYPRIRYRLAQRRRHRGASTTLPVLARARATGIRELPR